MGKIHLSFSQKSKEKEVSRAAFIDSIDPVRDAAKWAENLVMCETRGPGDTDNAMRRVARHAGVPYSILWKLRYRRPGDIPTKAFLRLLREHSGLRSKLAEKQMRILKNELEYTEALSGAAHNSVAASQALVDEVYDTNEAPLAAACHRQMAMTEGGR